MVCCLFIVYIMDLEVCCCVKNFLEVIIVEILVKRKIMIRRKLLLGIFYDY